MSLRLLLVRHGLSSFNKERRIQGRDDLSNLTDEGHDQARALGRSLQEVTIDAVYSSPLKRAASTTAFVLVSGVVVREEATILRPLFAR